MVPIFFGNNSPGSPVFILIISLSNNLKSLWGSRCNLSQNARGQFSGDHLLTYSKLGPNWRPSMYSSSGRIKSGFSSILNLKSEGFDLGSQIGEASSKHSDVIVAVAVVVGSIYYTNMGT